MLGSVTCPMTLPLIVVNSYTFNGVLNISWSLNEFAFKKDETEKIADATVGLLEKLLGATPSSWRNNLFDKSMNAFFHQIAPVAMATFPFSRRHLCRRGDKVLLHYRCRIITWGVRPYQRAMRYKVTILAFSHSAYRPFSQALFLRAQSIFFQMFVNNHC